MDLVKYCTDEIARHKGMTNKDPTHLVMNAETLDRLTQQIKDNACLKETSPYRNPATFIGLPIVVAYGVSGVYAGATTE